MFGYKNKRGLMPTPAPDPVAMPAPRRGLFGGNGSNALMVIGAALRDADGGDGNMAGVLDMIGRRRAQEQQIAQRQMLAQQLGLGGGEPMNIRKAAPILAQAALSGLDVGDLTNLYDKATPRVDVYRGQAYDPAATAPDARLGYETENRNGWNINPSDPNQPRFNEAPPVPGARPVFDQDSRHVGWTLSDGTLQAVAGVEGSKAAAQAAGVAPYQLERVMGPNGETITAPRSEFLGGAVRGPGAAELQYDKGKAEDSLKRFTAIQDAGQAARGKISQFQQIQGLLQGLDTGRLTPAMAEVAGLARTFGVQMDPNLGSKEAAAAIANKVALDLMGGSLGTGFSNADRDFVMGMAPRLALTPEGRNQLIQIGIAAAQRDQQVAQMARQWEQKAGRLDKPDMHGKTFFDYLDGWAAQNRLFK